MRKAILKSECQSKKSTTFAQSYNETWRKYLPHEVIIFLKFHKNGQKLWIFYLGSQISELPFLIRLQL